AHGPRCRPGRLGVLLAAALLALRPSVVAFLLFQCEFTRGFDRRRPACLSRRCFHPRERIDVLPCVLSGTAIRCAAITVRYVRRSDARLRTPPPHWRRSYGGWGGACRSPGGAGA